MGRAVVLLMAHQAPSLSLSLSSCIAKTAPAQKAGSIVSVASSSPAACNESLGGSSIPEFPCSSPASCKDGRLLHTAAADLQTSAPLHQCPTHLLYPLQAHESTGFMPCWPRARSSSSGAVVGTQIANGVRELEGAQALAAVQTKLGLDQHPLMAPQQLAEAALAAPGIQPAVLVFDVLAAAGPDFRLASR